MANLSQLAASIASLGASSKRGIKKINEQTVDALSVLMDDLSKNLDGEVVEMGIPNGGTINKAITTKLVDMQTGELNLATGNHFTLTLAANRSLTPINPAPAGRVNIIVLQITSLGAFAPAWWPGIKWAGGVVPAQTANGRDTYSFSSFDGGVTWDGYAVGKDIKAAV
jgi:hypothetical protein